MVENSEVLVSLRKPLHPEVIRLQPPPMPTPQIGTAENSLEVPTEEFVWLNPPTLSHEFHWDSTMGSSQSAPKLEVSAFGALMQSVLFCRSTLIKCHDLTFHVQSVIRESWNG